MSRPYDRNKFLKHRYGITVAQFDRMLEAQGGRCALCHTDNPKGKDNRLHVDHDHATGKVRGLLCHRCNVALGALGDNEESLLRALDYITSSSPTATVTG